LVAGNNSIKSTAVHQPSSVEKNNKLYVRSSTDRNMQLQSRSFADNEYVSAAKSTAGIYQQNVVPSQPREQTQRQQPYWDSRSSSSIPTAVQSYPRSQTSSDTRTSSSIDSSSQAQQQRFQQQQRFDNNMSSSRSNNIESVVVVGGKTSSKIIEANQNPFKRSPEFLSQETSKPNKRPYYISQPQEQNSSYDPPTGATAVVSKPKQSIRRVLAADAGSTKINFDVFF
jgi:hypothetical protein